MTITHPTDSSLSFDIKHFPAEKKSGEWQYSRGSPPAREKFTIEKVFYQDKDITAFVIDYCDSLFEKWEEDIND